jgi:hypothetical protein
MLSGSLPFAAGCTGRGALARVAVSARARGVRSRGLRKMADDKKKTKIDLKARLGKTQQGMSAVPLPVPGVGQESSSQPAPPPTADGVPAPSIPVPKPSVRPSGGGIAPPPGISPGIPLPPFAQQRQSYREPPAKPTAAQQTIKVEVAEEIHEERKKASKRMALVAGLTALVGLGAGFAIGGLQERSARAALAQKSAADLEKDVKTANEKINDLGEKLKEAYEKLGKKEFPADLATSLGAINIPFEVGNLEKPGVGNMPSKTLGRLFKYTSTIQELNSDKDQLRNVLAGVKDQAEKAWKEEKEPNITYSVVFRPEGGKGMIAELVPNNVKDQFALGAKDWPDAYTIVKPEMVQGKLTGVDKKATRWKKGDLTGNDPIAIPVSPQTTSFLTEKVVPQLLVKIREQIEIIYPKGEGTSVETEGLLKEADNLMVELHKLATAK